MKIIRSIQEMADFAADLNLSKAKKNRSIGFVPTMGSLHSGHMSLVENSAAENANTIVSIFVNPVQFEKDGDFESYPRDEKADIDRLEKDGKTKCVFIPSYEDMYPEGYASFVEVMNNMTSVLCGASRPGHFRGVATVVSKFLNILNPDVLYLGQKDMQQAAIIKKMIQDLNFGVRVSVCPIVREKDGLALSSRNKLLTPEERETAPVLYRAIQVAESMIELGEKSPGVIIKEMIRKIKEAKAEIDYVDIVDSRTFEKKNVLSGEVLIAAAVYIGKIRLIDNSVVTVEE
ncbi:MAG: pantoate--beta-alanine ligase [Candidatus Goldiibacteriota bacterium]